MPCDAASWWAAALPGVSPNSVADELRERVWALGFGRVRGVPHVRACLRVDVEPEAGVGMSAGVPQRSHKPARPRTDLSWQDKAACTSIDDPDIFFQPDRYPDALQWCDVCPVVTQCQQLGAGMGAGVWGGRIQTGAPKAADNRIYVQTGCGSEAGYKRHWRAGETACTACVEAANEASRKRKQRRVQS